MLKLILFDFDYTLVDSSEGIVHCFTTATNRLGLEVMEAEVIKKTIGLPLKDMFKTLYSENAELVDKFISYYKAEADQSATKMTYFYKDARDVLVSLRENGYKTGIVSTKFRSRIDESLDVYEMKDLFELVVGGEDVVQHKPSPEGILQAMSRLSTAHGETIYIGDSIYDFKAAQNAGIKFIAVLNGETPHSSFSELGLSHEWIAGNLTEVLAIIEKHSGL